VFPRRLTLGSWGDEASVVVHWRHREDEPALAQADRLDQDRAAGARQNDHVTGIDVASKDQILHE